MLMMRVNNYARGKFIQTATSIEHKNNNNNNRTTATTTTKTTTMNTKLSSPSSNNNSQNKNKYVDERTFLTKSLNFSSLCFAFPILAFSYPLSLMIRGTFKGVWDFRKEIRPPITQIWADFMTRTVMNVQFKLCSKEQLYRDKKCVYLSNHRAWADFFIDMSLCEGRTFTLSRMLVMYVFPVFMVPAVFVGAVFPFRRDKKGGYEELNASIDKHWSTFEQYFPGFLCYPEGTRNIKPHSLPLKRGMLRYAHSRKLPVQIIICAGKEKVFSQKRYAAERNHVLPVAYSAVIHSEEFPVFEDFAEAIRHAWEDEWACAYDHENKLDTLKSFKPKERTVRYEKWVDVFTVATVVSFLIICITFAHVLHVLFPKIVELGHH